MELNQIETLIQQVIEDQILISAVFSSPILSSDARKIVLRPIKIKDRMEYQLTFTENQKAFHQNLDTLACSELFKSLLKKYKQILVQTVNGDYQFLTNKKGHVAMIKNPPSKAQQNLVHNRSKNYMIQEGEPVPFLIHLEVMNSNGRVFPQKQNKFRQINRFLEMVVDIIPHLPKSRRIRVVDFGCGKGYLTFALFHLLRKMEKLDVEVIGVDLKKDVMENSQRIVESLGDQDRFKFIVGDINQADLASIDLMVALHACDIATDAALEKAILWNCSVILCAPCCQHELSKQIKNETLKPLLKHGILKERFASLVTDAARAQLLEAMGYQTQLLEFVDLEHTPKNLLIRAVRAQGKPDLTIWEDYIAFKQMLGIYPSLEKRIGSQLPQIQN